MDIKNTAGALTAIEELRQDSKIGKSKHFNASDRKLFWHRICGVPVILANLFVGIVLVSLQTTGGPGFGKIAVPYPNQSTSRSTGIDPATKTSRPLTSGKEIVATTTSDEGAQPIDTWKFPSFITLLSIFCAFGAASLSGVQTFFNFHKTSEGHRSVGNRYVHVSRQCKALQQRNRDLPYEADPLWIEYKKLYDEYHQINTEAEAFPTSARDLSQAKKAVEISPYKAPPP